MVPHVFGSFKRKARGFVEMRWRKVYESVQTAFSRSGQVPAGIDPRNYAIVRKKQVRSPVWQAGPAGCTSASSVSASQS